MAKRILARLLLRIKQVLADPADRAHATQGGGVRLRDRLKRAIRPAPPGTLTLGQVLADQPDDQQDARQDGCMAVTLRDIASSSAHRMLTPSEIESLRQKKKDDNRYMRNVPL